MPHRRPMRRLQCLLFTLPGSASPYCLQVFVEGTRAAVEAATAAASASTNGNGLTNGTAKIDASFVANSLAAESAASAAAAAAEAAEATGTTTKKRGRKPTKKKEEKEKPGERLVWVIFSGSSTAGAVLQGAALGQPGRVCEPVSGEQGCCWMRRTEVWRRPGLTRSATHQACGSAVAALAQALTTWCWAWLWLRSSQMATSSEPVLGCWSWHGMGS